jgi:hypothetical protein
MRTGQNFNKRSYVSFLIKNSQNLLFLVSKTLPIYTKRDYTQLLPSLLHNKSIFIRLIYGAILNFYCTRRAAYSQMRSLEHDCQVTKVSLQVVIAKANISSGVHMRACEREGCGGGWQHRVGRRICWWGLHKRAHISSPSSVHAANII